jgi:hypothetical protein
MGNLGFNLQPTGIQSICNFLIIFANQQLKDLD